MSLTSSVQVKALKQEGNTIMRGGTFRDSVEKGERKTAAGNKLPKFTYRGKEYTHVVEFHIRRRHYYWLVNGRKEKDAAIETIGDEALGPPPERVKGERKKKQAEKEILIPKTATAFMVRKVQVIEEMGPFTTHQEACGAGHEMFENLGNGQEIWVQPVPSKQKLEKGQKAEEPELPSPEEFE